MRLGFTLDPFGEVSEVIKRWKPTRCKIEKDFERSLVNELHRELKKQKIQAQYGSGRQQVDTVVEDKVPIELKKDLKKTTQLQRLIGQMEGYLQKWDRIILVLCGEVAPDLLKSLRKYAESKDIYAGTFAEDRITIIVKK